MSDSAEEIAILHVDDDEAFAELVATFLERENDRFRVETAASVTDGLARLTAGEFHCVVSDYDMPERDGLDFLDAVREVDPDLPFILYTGKGSEEVASEAISAGVTDYLQKEQGTGQYTVLANRVENAVEQYSARAALEASEERLSFFIEQSPLGVLEYDEDFEIVELNETGEEILGYTEEELRGHSWEILVTDNSYDNVDVVTRELAKASGGYHSIDENVRKDGSQIVCEWHNRVVTDDDGDVVAIFSLFQDVTERVERQKRLGETSARLTALFEESPDMINVHDVDGEILDPNPRLCEETGYSVDELTGMKVWELDQSFDPDEVTDLWNGMEQGDRQRLEGVYRRKDGSTFPVEVHIRRLDLAGEDRFIAISRDISERNRREEELERTNALLSTLVAGLPVGVLAEDRDRTVLAVNERLLELFGLSGSPTELVGANCRALAETASELVADSEGFVERIDELTAGLEPVHNESVELVDGRSLARSYEPIELPDGTGHLWMYRDTTEQRAREQQLRQQNERLSEFASVVSHDLRNPLNIAAGNVELAREEYESDHLVTAANALDRIGDLIDDLLTLARSGDDLGEREPVAMDPLVTDCWGTVETADATLRTDLASTVVADRSRLQQLVENLVRNSVEHGGDGVTVTVGDLPDGFYVEDNGPGIPADRRDTVFDAGYSTSRSGTGFGLSIVKQVAEAHGWNVRVTESAEGGARFEITGVEFVDAEE
ncbi:PAS domain S-box-containing protein [Halogranum gelatinilyticum]|uniref:histidine kinase n=1 Tax=Halogranum gelatinilyticum TaxID=660521 RepID=A0A1G9ZAE6_9EURY|nr:PAS domain S-box protein [Halogranum gelatinilyticum]SDN18370.1 PAS domain S-box-containing protein [Halogranum gelatinilyticum]